MKVVHCPACGEREPARYVEDGECRDCRGVETPDRPTHRTYHSPDDRERNREALDHRAARSRQRVLDNVANQGGRL